MRNAKHAPTGWLAGLLLAAALLGGCQTSSISQASVQRVNQSPVPTDKSGLPAVPVMGSTDYRLGPLDLLDIEVFGSPDLTRSVRISAGGDISMPLAGVIHAQGQTITELQSAIAKQLSERYLENPQVTVFVKEYMSQRVTVEGAVRTPGVVALTGRTSLLQLMAMSGGLDHDANPGGIVIYRTVEDRRRAAVFDIRKIRSAHWSTRKCWAATWWWSTTPASAPTCATSCRPHRCSPSSSRCSEPWTTRRTITWNPRAARCRRSATAAATTSRG